MKIPRSVVVKKAFNPNTILSLMEFNKIKTYMTCLNAKQKPILIHIWLIAYIHEIYFICNLYKIKKDGIINIKIVNNITYHKFHELKEVTIQNNPKLNMKEFVMGN